MIWKHKLTEALFFRSFSKYYQQVGMYSLTHNRIRFKFPFTLVKCFLSGENVTLKLNSLNILCELWLELFISSRSTARRFRRSCTSCVFREELVFNL